MSSGALSLAMVAALAAPAAAHAEESWAFTAPVQSALPQPSADTRNRNPIDAWLEVEQRARGLVPQPSAAPEVWLRRVHLDLIGLPPDPTVRARYLADPSPEASRRLVESLLSSTAHAERWARHWMDIWRYSDWYGLGDQLRHSQKHIWHWRDWIVDSLRSDTGYDRMIREMLAGDELAPTDPQVLRATGYLARNYFLFNRNTWLDDTIENVGKAFLGLTLNCAKCHDHKFDPITQADYFAFRAFFEPHQVRLDSLPGEADLERNGIPRVYDAHPDAPTHIFIRGDERQPDTSRTIGPAVPAFLQFTRIDAREIALPEESWAPNLRPFAARDLRALVDREQSAAREALGAATHALTRAQPGQRSAAAEAVHKSVRALLEVGEKRGRLNAALDAERPGKPSVGYPVTSRKALEGPTEKPESLASQFPSTSTGRRRALAEWVTSRRNPLTARVAVNHVWMRHFGAPLVPSVFDFGRTCPAPPNQRLLDWLACDLMDHQWSLRRLHRLIVTSQAYQRTSSMAGCDERTRTTDRENQFYWRFPGRRMEAEVIRDSLLFLRGDLDLASVGGPVVPMGEQAASRRRSLYFARSLEEENPLLTLFDQAKILECYRRQESIVPQQALALANSGFALEAAEMIAARIAGGEGAFVDRAFEWVLGRAPTADERAECGEMLIELEAGAPPGSEGVQGPADDELRRAFARASLVHVLINHNDFISIR